MNRFLYLFAVVVVSFLPSIAKTSGNPILPGWYADPEAIVYHRRPAGDDGPNHRATCIDRLYFDKDNRILPVKITREGVARR